jgi:hypothetical protein
MAGVGKLPMCFRICTPTRKTIKITKWATQYPNHLVNGQSSFPAYGSGEVFLHPLAWMAFVNTAHWWANTTGFLRHPIDKKR